MGYTIREYLSESGQSPYRAWLSSLDEIIRARIQARVLRFEHGNLGDYKQVGEGVYEARLMFGPGCRLYFSIHKRQVILLLCEGDKKSQSKDIRKAIAYWNDYVKQEVA